jgi:radical SAM protein with 4Fe4S-binding SPASM domain
MFLNDAYAASSLHRRALSDVIRNMLPRWSELPQIERRRRGALNSCRGCAGHAHCGGGCMGRAFAAHGDLMTVEDRCVLRQAVYAWRHVDDDVKSISGR